MTEIVAVLGGDSNILVYCTQSAFIMQNLCQSLPLDLTVRYDDISRYS